MGLVLVLGFAIVAQGGIDKKAAAFVLCKNKKDVRTIRILQDEMKAENCTITYSKGTNEEVMGENRSIATCRSILKNIQTNLENSRWSCRNVETARVMTSSEVVR